MKHHTPRITCYLAILAATLLMLAPQGAAVAAATPGDHTASPPVLVDPSGGVLPDQAADKAVQMITEKLVSQGGRYHDLEDARLAPDQLPMAAAIAASGDYRIDALLSPYQWGLPALTYSFYSTAAFGSSSCGQTVGDVSDGVKANVRQIMAWYSSLLNVDIAEVAETPTSRGLIRIKTSSGAGYAYSYFPAGDVASCGGDVHLNPDYDRLGDTNGFQHPAGQHGYVSLIHEIGHSLGLKHPFDGSPVLPAAEENDSHTVMSYTWHGAAPGTPMAYDIMALQHIYGAKPKNTASESYLFSPRGPDQYGLGGQQYLATPYLTKQAIWDSAGSNVLDFSALPASISGYRLDLKGTGWLTAGSQYATSYFGNGTALGSTVAISGVVSSGSSDTIYANPSPNVFKGYSRDRTTGQDVIYDADGADTVDLSGFSPSDVTQTLSGNDLVLGLASSGSITLKDYHLGKQPQIAFATVPPANTPPTAVVQATPISGNSPLSVSFDGSGSTDPGGSIASYSWSFGDGATGTGPTAQHTYTSPGSYTATLTVTDNGGATATASVLVSAQQSSAGVIRVADLALSAVAGARNGKTGQVVVTVTDLSGAPVSGAMVSGRWSGVVSGSSTGATNADGKVTLTSKATSKAGTLTFSVTGVTPPTGTTYDAGRNLESSVSLAITK